MLSNEGAQQEEDCYNGDEDASRDPPSVETRTHAKRGNPTHRPGGHDPLIAVCGTEQSVHDGLSRDNTSALDTVSCQDKPRIRWMLLRGNVPSLLRWIMESMSRCHTTVCWKHRRLDCLIYFHR